MKRNLGLLFILALIGACQQSTSTLPEEGILPVDFQVFYELFHRDSTYQKEHIHFPLEGLPDYADSLTIVNNSFHWEASDWVIHQQQLLNDSEFTREVSMFGDFVVRERFIHKERPLITERRFAKEGNEWYLIYYAGLNTFHRL
ncbi:MAG: DUF4348 domain-containing protein [Saprospiraceae bacterium]|nr:DUF4348 domain-containing protein [Saprospiraceae bacterium]